MDMVNINLSKSKVPSDKNSRLNCPTYAKADECFMCLVSQQIKMGIYAAQMSNTMIHKGDNYALAVGTIFKFQMFFPKL